VAKNTMRRKITIGAVELIRVTGVEKCGGAVVKHLRMTQDVSFQSMKVRRMMKMMLTQMISYKTS